MLAFQVHPATALDDTTSAPEYCVYLVTAQNGGPDLVDVPGELRCYPNFGGAIYDATGGGINIPNLQPVELTQGLLDSSIGTKTVIGVEYWNRNYNANPNREVIYSVAGGTGCTSTISWNLDNVGPYDNDKFSSARGYAGCNHVYHWENDFRRGSSLDCSPCADMGAMNNQTTSLSWTH
jgi:hypothetical protein